LNELRVSVEGHTDELQRDIRNIPLKPVLETCRNLQFNGVPVTLRVTLNKKNYKFLSKMIDYFKALGFTRFSMYEFQAVGRGSDCADEYALDENELIEVLEMLSSYPVSDGIETLKLSLSASRIPLLTDYEKKLAASGYKCLDLSNTLSLTVNYNGDLGVCPWIVNTDVIGTYQEQNFVSDVAKYIADGLLEHNCEHCSAIRVEWQTVHN
jgi:MoaA/NifB/PqqE/SkfB family radical SAM enzyme